MIALLISHGIHEFAFVNLNKIRKVSAINIGKLERNKIIYIWQSSSLTSLCAFCIQRIN